MKNTTIRVPASTGNLGPGFDCLGLALDLWNEATFTLKDKGLRIKIRGEGTDRIPNNQHNLVYKAFKHTYTYLNLPMPSGLEIICNNQIPLSSGLGSSGSATLLGILGANALLELPLKNDEILQLGTELEGHTDNIAPSLLGGLTISTENKRGILTEKLTPYPWKIVVVLPNHHLSTRSSRNALPKQVPLSDAAQNIGNSLLVVQALQSGDLSLLIESMKDRLHQPYRLPLIPGAEKAITKVQEFGAAAALSGAGPSVVAFTKSGEKEIGDLIATTFKEAGLASRIFHLKIDIEGSKIIL